MTTTTVLLGLLLFVMTVTSVFAKAPPSSSQSVYLLSTNDLRESYITEVDLYSGASTPIFNVTFCSTSEVCAPIWFKGGDSDTIYIASYFPSFWNSNHALSELCSVSVTGSFASSCVTVNIVNETLLSFTFDSYSNRVIMATTSTLKDNLEQLTFYYFDPLTGAMDFIANYTSNPGYSYDYLTSDGQGYLYLFGATTYQHLIAVLDLSTNMISFILGGQSDPTTLVTFLDYNQGLSNSKGAFFTGTVQQSQGNNFTSSVIEVVVSVTQGIVYLQSFINIDAPVDTLSTFSPVVTLSSDDSSIYALGSSDNAIYQISLQTAGVISKTEFDFPSGQLIIGGILAL